MTIESNEIRIANVERDLADVRKELRALHTRFESKLDVILDRLNDLRQAGVLDEVALKTQTQRLEARLCPDPGACLRLEPRIKALEVKISGWHDAQQQLKGAMKTVRTFWLGIGAVATTAAWILKDWITRN